jgi:hypothetical protein
MTFVTINIMGDNPTVNCICCQAGVIQWLSPTKYNSLSSFCGVCRRSLVLTTCQLHNSMVWYFFILIPHPIHALDHGFEPWSGQTKGCQIGIFCFSTKHSKMRMIFLTISWQEQVTFWRYHVDVPFVQEILFVTKADFKETVVVKKILLKHLSTFF